MKALILVDLQNDFTPGLPGGALAVSGGDQVIPVANRLMPRYEFVVASQDWHPPNHKSFASQHPGHQNGDVIEWKGLKQILWPDHCVQGTVGAQLCEELDQCRLDEIVRKGTDADYDSYSAFFDNGHRKATGMADLLRSRGADAVDIMGLATDVCVNFTALDAAQLGFKTSVILKGCRGVELEQGDCDRAIDAMRHAGVNVIEDS